MDKQLSVRKIRRMYSVHSFYCPTPSYSVFTDEYVQSRTKEWCRWTNIDGCSILPTKNTNRLLNLSPSLTVLGPKRHLDDLF